MVIWKFPIDPQGTFLPRDTWIFFSTVLNPVLEEMEMLLRRGFVKGQAVDPVHGEHFDVLERLPEGT